MSISSSNYSEYAEKKKEEWRRQLLEASKEKSWDLVERLLVQMNVFHFTE